MEYKLERTIEIKPTIDELAHLIWELNSKEQAQLIDSLMCIDMFMDVQNQVCSVANELTENGENFFDMFEWFRNNKE